MYTPEDLLNWLKEHNHKLLAEALTKARITTPVPMVYPSLYETLRRAFNFDFLAKKREDAYFKVRDKLFRIRVKENEV